MIYDFHTLHKMHLLRDRICVYKVVISTRKGNKSISLASHFSLSLVHIWYFPHFANRITCDLKQKKKNMWISLILPVNTNSTYSVTRNERVVEKLVYLSWHKSCGDNPAHTTSPYRYTLESMYYKNWTIISVNGKS